MEVENWTLSRSGLGSAAIRTARGGTGASPPATPDAVSFTVIAILTGIGEGWGAAGERVKVWDTARGGRRHGPGVPGGAGVGA